ncbi:MAG: restriction endonuclease subunit S [Bacteroidota bacterium]
MEVKKGYKKTEVGIIPEDWSVATFGDVFNVSGGFSASRDQLSQNGYCYLHYGDIHKSTKAYIDVQAEYVDIPKLDIPLQRISSKSLLNDGDVVFVDASEDDEGASRHIVVINKEDIPYISGLHTIVVKSKGENINKGYRRYCFQTRDIKRQFYFYAVGTKVTGISKSNIVKIFLPLPSPSEQRAIAAALSDVDALINSLDRLIAKKRDLKHVAMQELLTGKRRQPGFGGEWEIKTLNDITNCLDNFRVPLNDTQRSQMRGDYPYCGANGVLDYVNDYVIDDDFILIAEDGGYFDEYEYRPIAYRMIGKCWVNNHAHILKTKEGFDQGFVFYSLVHKNILRFLASGTRAKLNKYEMFKIEIDIPLDAKEQTAIATVLSDMDAEITALEQRRNKTIALKQGIMQELLTGRIRLMKGNPA